MENLTLKDLIEVELLQKILTKFSDLTGLAILGISQNEKYTDEINFTDYCKYTRSSACGRKNCFQDNLPNTQIAAKHGVPIIYNCFSGLVDIVVPIMLEDKLIGSILCGQVLTEPPDLERFKKLAKNYGLDEKKYIEYVKKVKIVDIEELKIAADLLYLIAKSLSVLAMNKYQVHKNVYKQENAKNIMDIIDASANLTDAFDTVCKSIVKIFNVENVFVIEFDKIQNSVNVMMDNNLENTKKHKFNKLSYDELINSMKDKVFYKTKTSSLVEIDRNNIDQYPESLLEYFNNEKIDKTVIINVLSNETKSYQLFIESCNKQNNLSEDDKDYLLLLAKRLSLALSQEMNQTEEKRVEKVKSEFLSVVSHELRTPITAIIGAMEILKSKTLGDFSPAAENLLNIAHSNSYNLLNLINDILDVEKLAADKLDFFFEKQDFQKIVDETILEMSTYAQKYATKINTLNVVENINVNIDKNRLNQVLRNLISNSVKFSNNKDVDCSCYKKGKNVYFKITNYCEEILKVNQPKLFTKFYQVNSSDTRKQGGTGLGLAIAKRIIEKMNGSIRFTSNSKETTFYIKLPISN